MPQRMVWIALCLIGLITSIALGEPGQWVTIHLNDGRVLSGEVLEETPDMIKINCHLAGITSAMRFAAKDVAEIEREESLDTDDLKRGDDWRVKKSEDDLESGKAADRGGYAVIPAVGVIGEDLTTFFFEQTCERAIQSGAELVVYDLESPGGYLHVLWDIRQTLDAFEDEIQIAFYANGDCFSAAAMLCMSSQHFYVGPDAAFGAAVIWQTGEDGQPTAVDAKFAAAEASKWRREAEKRGRPGVVMDALIRQEAEVWADQSTTPWTLFPGRREGGDAELTEVDSGRSVLSMTGSEGISLGAADGMADRAEEIAERVGVDRHNHSTMDGKDAARVVSRIQSKNIHELQNRLAQISKNYDRINRKVQDGTLTQSALKREVRSLRTLAMRLMDMYEELDYARDYLRAEFGITADSIQGYIDWLTGIWNDLK